MIFLQGLLISLLSHSIFIAFTFNVLAFARALPLQNTTNHGIYKLNSYSSRRQKSKIKVVTRTHWLPTWHISKCHQTIDKCFASDILKGGQSTYKEGGIEAPVP